jgi:hypothetical protein
MKNIRNLVTLIGLSMVAFALAATGARAQGLNMTKFAGTFTLPNEAQWGRATLPAGQYSLYYGNLSNGTAAVVEVVGKENSNPHVLIPAGAIDDASTTKSALVCVREGDTLIVRALEIPQLGQAVNFRMPRGTQLMAQKTNGNKNVQIAEGPMLIQRIPVSLAQK